MHWINKKLRFNGHVSYENRCESVQPSESGTGQNTKLSRTGLVLYVQCGGLVRFRRADWVRSSRRFESCTNLNDRRRSCRHGSGLSVWSKFGKRPRTTIGTTGKGFSRLNEVTSDVGDEKR